jgi:hypothetical protein
METIYTKTSYVYNGKTYVGGNYEYYDNEDIKCYEDYQKIIRLSEYRAIRNLMSKIPDYRYGKT